MHELDNPLNIVEPSNNHRSRERDERSLIGERMAEAGIYSMGPIC